MGANFVIHLWWLDNYLGVSHSNAEKIEKATSYAKRAARAQGADRVVVVDNAYPHRRVDVDIENIPHKPEDRF